MYLWEECCQVRANDSTPISSLDVEFLEVQPVHQVSEYNSNLRGAEAWLF